eukprot:1153345-Pelagomonas_calceolata.AAC.7
MVEEEAFISRANKRRMLYPYEGSKEGGHVSFPRQALLDECKSITCVKSDSSLDELQIWSCSQQSSCQGAFTSLHHQDQQREYMAPQPLASSSP